MRSVAHDDRTNSDSSAAFLVNFDRQGSEQTRHRRGILPGARLALPELPRAAVGLGDRRIRLARFLRIEVRDLAERHRLGMELRIRLHVDASRHGVDDCGAGDTAPWPRIRAVVFVPSSGRARVRARRCR